MAEVPWPALCQGESAGAANPRWADGLSLDHFPCDCACPETMPMRRCWFRAWMLLTLTLTVAPAAAEPVWQRISVFKRIESSPDQDYAITEDNGPWMIMAVTFLGDHAERDAHELVMELRSRYKLPAYTHAMDFDFSKPIVGRALEADGSVAKMHYQRGNKYKEIAVLVGDYSTVDDPQAQKVLQKLKLAQPECLQPQDGKPTSRPLAGLRAMQREAHQLIGNEQKDYGPMGHAFVTTNPLLPREYFRPSGLDPLVVKMNQNVEHSLLDCPKKYSVRVATFMGRSVILEKNTQHLLDDNDEAESKLAEAAMKAHKLTVALRAKGYEAYEFHDRYLSLVTVGSFDAVGTPRADGKIEINPQIHRLMETFGAKKSATAGSTAPVGKAKSLGGIAFDVQPLPVEVPRESVSGSFTRASLFD
ncbi:MAG: hypothetical protein K1X74_23100 [Pirellulales bacterium]|nr:hypothetical protein [Pirellulales bacterium]